MAFHLRRRLSAKEQALIGNALDLRGTAEALTRLERIKGRLSEAAMEFAIKEIVQPVRGVQ